MVALLWFGNIGAVYPLLQILFYDQDCQRWIEKQLTESESQHASLVARLEEAESVEQLLKAGPESVQSLRSRYRDRVDFADKARRELHC